MTGQGNGTGRDVFRELWQRWTEVVRQFALRRRSRRWLSEREYHALRQSLLEACRSLAGTADGEARALYERLESVAEPWLTLYALERAEREVLFDLFQGCRQVGRELGGRTWSSLVRAWAVPGLALVGSVASVILLGRTGRRVLGLLWEQVQDGARILCWALTRPSETAWWLAGFVLVTLLVGWLVLRVPRSD